MTTLDAYLARSDAKKLTDLAREMGVSKARLSQLRDSRDWPPALALKCEQATGGRLSASKLCPVIAQARKATPRTSPEAA